MQQLDTAKLPGIISRPASHMETQTSALEEIFSPMVPDHGPVAEQEWCNTMLSFGWL